jgi:hypothetical protein
MIQLVYNMTDLNVVSSKLLDFVTILGSINKTMSYFE